MAKPKNLLSYSPQWEALAKALLTKGPILEYPGTLSRKNAIDVRQTFYGYRAALRRALDVTDTTYSDGRKAELSLWYRNTMAYQCHIDPNPNDRRNDAALFTLKFIQQDSTDSMKTFFNGMSEFFEGPEPPPVGPKGQAVVVACRDGDKARLCRGPAGGMPP